VEGHGLGTRVSVNIFVPTRRDERAVGVKRALHIRILLQGSVIKPVAGVGDFSASESLTEVASYAKRADW